MYWTKQCIAQQVRLKKGNILAASRLKKNANGGKEEASIGEGQGLVFDAEQKENLAPAAAGDFSSPNRWGAVHCCTSSLRLVDDHDSCG